VLPVIEAVTPAGEDVIAKDKAGAVVERDGVPDGPAGGVAVFSKRPITVVKSLPVGTFAWQDISRVIEAPTSNFTSVMSEHIGPNSLPGTGVTVDG
jgi:hypothetical protein